MASSSRTALLVGTVGLAASFAACGAQLASTTESPAAATIGPTLRAVATSTPSPMWTLVTSGDLPGGVITQMARDSLVEGDHGGGHVDQLPARFFVDYAIHGSCRFGVKFYSTSEGVRSPSATLSVLASGGSTSNRWSVLLAPGPYEVSPSATDGCTYLVTVDTIPAPGSTLDPGPASTPVLSMIDGELPSGILQQTARSSLTEGGHGLGNFISLPRSFLIDYTASGSCDLQIVIWSEALGPEAPVVALPLSLHGESTSGTWAVGVDPPGSYAVDPRGFEGCTYLYTVRAG